ncbi:MAG: GGDEF domain-containing protein [Pseudomonadota bacterium]
MINNKLDKTRLHLLLLPFQHSAYIQRHRAGVLSERISIFSVFFALLVGLWIAVDLFLLPIELALKMLILRLLSVAGFLYIARSGLRSANTMRITMRVAMWRLFLFMINPFIFYIIALALFSEPVVVDDWGKLLINIYTLLPFLIVAGLSLFPLTFLESSIFGFSTVILMMATLYLSPSLEWTQMLPSIWILTLLVWVSILTAMIQLNYMLTLIHRVTIDPLTKAYTRNSGMEMIDIYFHISLEHNTPFAIAFFDLDRFKAINDNYGHKRGDIALKDMVRHLQNYLRQSDMVVRWGGEEFVVILPNTDALGLEIIMHRILQGWFGQRPEGEPLTASIGYTERLSDSLADWPELIQLADERMYKAKENGRARVVGCGGKVILPLNTN